MSEFALTRVQRAALANEILDAMRVAYEAEGVDGDFDDARRYYRDDASDEEIIADHEKWCKK